MTVYLYDNLNTPSVPVHESHRKYETSYSVECHDCWGCSCHAADILAKPCQHTVETDIRPPGAADAVVKQAYRYGEQIRQLEDQGAEKDRVAVRKAWDTFRTQLENTSLLSIARDSYSEAYGQ